jgi:uncharacterized protein
MDSEPRTLVVTGVGVAQAAPDQCLVHVSFNVLSEAVSDALDQASDIATAAIDQLKANGYRAADLQTTNISVEPFIDRDLKRVTAHTAKYQMTVRTRSPKDLGALLGLLHDSAGDQLQVSGIELVHSNPDILAADARRKAVEDASTRAGDLADSAGVRLGQILQIAEGGIDGGRGPAKMGGRLMSGAGLSSAPIEPGVLSASVRVTVTYQIES